MAPADAAKLEAWRAGRAAGGAATAAEWAHLLAAEARGGMAPADAAKLAGWRAGLAAVGAAGAAAAAAEWDRLLAAEAAGCLSPADAAKLAGWRAGQAAAGAAVVLAVRREGRERGEPLATTHAVAPPHGGGGGGAWGPVAGGRPRAPKGDACACPTSRGASDCSGSIGWRPPGTSSLTPAR